MVPSNSIIPSASILKANLQKSHRPGPASLTKPQHYFDQEAQHAMLKCQLCAEKFLRKSDLFIHLQQHGVRIIGCQLCEDKFLDVADLKRHLTSAHGRAQDSGDSDGEPGLESPVSAAVARRPGLASRTNAPKENRGSSGHLASTAENGSCAGFPCEQCGKVLMHKQSYVSHMRVIHGDYYGGNKWRGSSVVEMVLGGQKQQRQETAASRAALSPHRLGLACEFCPKAFTDQAHLDDHIQSKHPNLTKRIQAFKAALGLNDSDEPDTKRIKLDYKEVHKRETDEITNNNNTINNNNNIKSLEDEKMEEKSKDDAKAEDLSQVKPAQESDVNNLGPKEAEEEDDEHEDDEDEFEPTDRNDDTRFEAIQEEFEFDGKLIKPSYCVLPFITDDEVEACTKRNIAEYYEQPEEYSEDEEGQMVIDESPQPSPENLILTRRDSPPPAPVNNNFNNNELKINSFGQGFANAINICRKEEPSVVSPQPQPTHTVKFEPLHHAAATAALYYPAVFPDFSLPFPPAPAHR